MSDDQPANPLGIKAVVVGIEYHGGHEAWSLDGPALDACRMAAHLRDRGVPAENIWLHAAPLPKNLEVTRDIAGPLTVRPGTRQAIRESLTTGLQRSSSDLLMIFWGGHGFVDRANKRRLLWAEATGEDKQNFMLSSLLRFMRTRLYNGHPRQLAIVDVCANFERQQDWSFSPPSEKFPSGDEEMDIEQEVLFAAAEGFAAGNDDRRQAGLFSELILERFASASQEEWPPKANDLHCAAKRHFSILRKRGLTVQVPSRLFFSSPTDSEDIRLDQTRVSTMNPSREHDESFARVRSLMSSPEASSSLLGFIPGDALPRLRLLSERALTEVGTVASGYAVESRFVEDAPNDFSRGLYVNRNIEGELTELLRGGSHIPIVVRGEPGVGKTSLLWGVATKLAAKDDREVFFIKGTWLVAPPGTDPPVTPAAVIAGVERVSEDGRKSTVLIDTADLLVNDERTYLALTEIVAETSARGASVLVTSRPVEARLLPASWARKNLDSYSVSDVSAEADGGSTSPRGSEFERAVAAHATFFCRSPQQARELSAQMTAAVSRRWPVGALCLRPLTLRMLFELYSPGTVPVSIDVTDLYERYWVDRVCRDRREWSRDSGSLDDPEQDLSATALRIALEMLRQGTPEIQLSGIAVDSPGESASLQRDVDLLCRRGVGDISGRSFRFFHQTMYEFAASKGLLTRNPKAVLRILIRRATERPDDYFLLSVLEQTWLCAWRTGEARLNAMILALDLLRQIRAASANEAQSDSCEMRLPYSLQRVVLSVVTQSPSASEEIYGLLAQALHRVELAVARDCLALIPPPCRSVGDVEIELLGACATRTDAAWVTALEALTRVADQDPAVAVRALGPMKLDSRVAELSRTELATRAELPALLVRLVQTDVDAVLPFLGKAVSAANKFELHDYLTRIVDHLVELPELPGSTMDWVTGQAGGSGNPRLVASLAVLHARKVMAVGREAGWEHVEAELSSTLFRCQPMRTLTAADSALVAGILSALGEGAPAQFSPAVASLLDPIDNPVLHALFSRGCLTALLVGEGCSLLEAAVGWLVAGLPVSHRSPEGPAQRWADTIRRALDRPEVSAERVAVMAGAAALRLASTQAARRELWLNPDGLMRVIIRSVAAGDAGAIDAFSAIADSSFSLTTEARRTLLQQVSNFGVESIEASLLLDVLIERNEVNSLESLFQMKEDEIPRELLVTKASRLAALARNATASSRVEVRRAGCRIWHRLIQRDLVEAPPWQEVEQRYGSAKDSVVRGVVAEIAGAGLTQGAYELDALRDLLKPTLGSDGVMGVINSFDTRAVRSVLVTSLAVFGQERAREDLLTLAFLPPVETGVVAKMGSFLDSRHRRAEGPTLPMKLSLLTVIATRLADKSISHRVGRDVAAGWSPFLNELLTEATPQEQLALLEAFPAMNQDFAARLALMLHPSRDPELRQRMADLIDRQDIGDRTRKNLQESLKQLANAASLQLHSSWWELDQDLSNNT